MVNIKIWGFALLGTVVLAIVAIYWFYFSKPTTFLTNEQLIGKINQAFPEAPVRVIRDIVHVDERHIFVPFISEDDHYGGSYWAWQKHKWQAVAMDTIGGPHVWKINSKDPSTFHLLWNIHPDDQVSYLKFYCVRDRGYHGFDGGVMYDPKIQMEKKVSFEENSYGVLRLPDNWLTFMKAFHKVESAKVPDLLFSSIFPVDQMYFGWTPYDKMDKEVILKSTGNGGGFSTGNGGVDFIRYLNESEIESPK
ncbi:hypothetical protein [Neobacillus sp.]|uniref:hypothetical protein n=1 Tax=Neobacillus sp. TaxID=2675273 RepID=UPI0028A0AFE8|nr:hypothetical protein [Neobacillus sp.]